MIPFRKRYQRLEAWQAAHHLVLLTYRFTKSFPHEELYGLTSQARRAAFSVAANIAEGSAKKGPREFRRFLDIAVGSLSELAYIFHLVKDLVLIEPAKWSELDQAQATAADQPDDLERRGRGCLSRRAVGAHQQHENREKLRWPHG
jgi:four helix bundle protein